MQYRAHQIYTIGMTYKCIAKADADTYPNILWGHIPRSGKTFMMAGIIETMLKHDQADNANYVVITTVPNETINQYLSVLKSLKINIITSKIAVASLSGKNIIVMSKQLLTNKANADLEIANVKLVLMDEAHFGGMTDIGMNLINSFPCPRVFITATPNKVIDGVKVDHFFKWDLEDVNLMKAQNYPALFAKYEQFEVALNRCKQMYKLSDGDIKSNYIDYPQLNIIGLDFVKLQQSMVIEDDWDWNPESLLRINKATYEMQFHASADMIFRHIITKSIKKIEAMNKAAGQRPILNRRDPSVIMCFLPSKNVSTISNHVRHLIESINPNFEICICNTIDSEIGIKQTIATTLIAAKENRKKAVIALTGTQGHLGLTIPRCDLVLLMNNSRSNEFIMQSMFRSMTESEKKLAGWVIDINVFRSIEFVAEYSKFISNNDELSNADAIKSILNSAVIRLHLSENDNIASIEEIEACYAGAKQIKNKFFKKLMWVE